MLSDSDLHLDSSSLTMIWKYDIENGDMLVCPTDISLWNRHHVLLFLCFQCFLLGWKSVAFEDWKTYKMRGFFISKTFNEESGR
jgi:hypothetical protein